MILLLRILSFLPLILSFISLICSVKKYRKDSAKLSEVLCQILFFLTLVAQVVLVFNLPY